MNTRSSRISEILAFLFGLLMILIIFGDTLNIKGVEVAGNLDTIFGLTFWPVMDVIYPLASIVVFLLYGRSRGRIRVSPKSILFFLIFLASLVLIQIDDVFVVIGRTLTLPELYWTVAKVVYFFAASITFFAFGLACSRPQ